MSDELLKDKLKQTEAAQQWEAIGASPHHGFCLPLSSLHSDQSCGIGEFLDLIPLIEWAQSVGMDVIQLLPLNDTGLGTSPYDAISAIALNPLFLSLSSLPELDRIPNYKEKLQKISYWNRTPRVKFHIVRELKNVFLKEYVPTILPHLEQQDHYQSFLKKEESWLTSFALFKAIKEKQYWKSWEEWPSHLKSPTEANYQKLLIEHKDAITFHTVLQYLSFMQFEKVREAAALHKVYLKGDIPILISRDSADVWHRRNYFLLHLAAGAPPDRYTRLGQYWGFPMYNWEEIEKDNYSWWRARLKAAAELYDIYRIDHVVGFFRMWGIPLGQKATDGSFYPEQEEAWIPHGEKIMRMMLHASPILPIGEDLGLVPESVKQSLYKLGICGTKMMRWERTSEEGAFISPSQYEPMTMTTVSTHDSDTLQLWWRHFPKEAKAFSDYKGWDYLPFLSLERHREMLLDAHHSASLFHINLLQEYLALVPGLVADNPNEERINVPGKILDTNWTYRFRPSIKELTSNGELSKTIQSLLSKG